jgi:hypothetical protein
MHWFGDVEVKESRRVPRRADLVLGGLPFADTTDQRVQRAAEATAIRSSLLAGASALLKWQDEGTCHRSTARSWRWRRTMWWT